MKYFVGAVAILIMIAMLLFTSQSHASTSVLSLVPNGTTTGGWNTSGTGGNSCSGHCDYVDEVSSGNGDGNTSYLETNSNSAVEEFSMQNISVGQTATSIQVYIYAQCRTNPLFGNGGYIYVNPKIQGSSLGQSTITIGSCGTNSWSLFNYTYNGTWTQADINSLALNFTMAGNGGFGTPNMGISATYVEVTMRSPDLNQSTGRVYNNANNSTPGSALAASNVQADVQKGAAFRIRAGIVVTDYQWVTGAWGATSPNTYKLQFAQRSVGSCSAQSSGWADVQSGSGAIRWNDNAGVADGATISSYGSDPPVTGTKVLQNYRESNPFTNSSNVTTGNTGLWDFSLKDYSTNYGTPYCFRVVKSDSSQITYYTNFPSIITVGSLDIDIVNSGGTPVSSPNTAFSSVIVQPECQSSSATLGVSSQAIRVTNNIATNGWSLALAATNGPTAFWTNNTNGQYDYNDSGGSPNGCSDSGDTDSLAGQLTVTPGTGSATPQSGCSSSGVSLGSMSKFTEGSVDSITIASATSATPRFCYFTVVGVGLSQQIPTYRPVGSYTFDFTLTVLAL